MAIPKAGAAFAVLGALSLLATAGCSAGTTNTNAPGASNAPQGGGSSIVIRGCTPENPLIAGNTTEVCGGNLIDAVTAKLIHYNTKTAAPEMDIAESINTTDNKVFTVKLNKGYKFSDGTEVKAKNFVDSWNFTAYGPNGYSGADFMGAIKGIDDMACGTKPDPKDATKQVPDCEGKPPAAKELAGLKVVDDYTFTIETTEPTSNLPVRLGYSAFVPQPDAFFKDPKSDAFGKQPIGAGPYKVTSNTATEIVLEKNKEYSGKHAGNIDKIVYRIYTDPAASYTDLLANNVDVIDVIPPDQLAGDAWKAALGDRAKVAETGIMQWLTISPSDEQLKDNVKLRQALSMAIDRPTITKQVFNGTRTPASGWVSPAVDGYKADQCGAACIFDAAKAKALYTESGGYKGQLMLSVNPEGGHKLWADAVCNGWKNTLGVDCAVNVTPDFKTLRTKIKAGEFKGVFRGGWQMDYPSIENFLTPIYKKGAGSNDSKYDNPAFEKLLIEGAAATDPKAANAKYQEAEALLAQTFPTIPLWYQATPYSYSTKVTDVNLNAFGAIAMSEIKLK